MKIAGLGIDGTDIVIPAQSAEIAGYYAAHNQAEEQGIVTPELAQAYLTLFGSNFPADLIGRSYSKIKGSQFSTNVVLRHT